MKLGLSTALCQLLQCCIQYHVILICVITKPDYTHLRDKFCLTSYHALVHKSKTTPGGDLSLTFQVLVLYLKFKRKVAMTQPADVQPQTVQPDQ